MCFPGRKVQDFVWGQAAGRTRGTAPSPPAPAPQPPPPEPRTGPVTWHSPVARALACGFTADTCPPLRRGGTNNLNGFSLSMASEVSEPPPHNRRTNAPGSPAALRGGRGGGDKRREAGTRDRGVRGGGARRAALAPQRSLLSAAPWGAASLSAGPRSRRAARWAEGPSFAMSPAPPRGCGWGCAVPSGARWGGRSAGGPRGGGFSSICRGCPGVAPAALRRGACSSGAGGLRSGAGERG